MSILEVNNHSIDYSQFGESITDHAACMSLGQRSFMTNSGPAPRFDDANQHFQEIHYKLVSPVDHISVGLGETTWALQVGTSVVLLD